MSIKVRTFNKRTYFSALEPTENFVTDIISPISIFQKIPGNFTVEGKEYNSIILYDGNSGRVSPFTFFGSDYQVYKVEIIDVIIAEKI